MKDQPPLESSCISELSQPTFYFPAALRWGLEGSWLTHFHFMPWRLGLGQNHGEESSSRFVLLPYTDYKIERVDFGKGVRESFHHTEKVSGLAVKKITKLVLLVIYSNYCNRDQSFPLFLPTSKLEIWSLLNLFKKKYERKLLLRYSLSKLRLFLVCSSQSGKVKSERMFQGIQTTEPENFFFLYQLTQKY